jgi:predicted thioesterase
MNFNLKIGMTHESILMVEEKHTASAYGSGSIYVFATPAMIGLMENAALNCVDEALGNQWTTVGTHVDVSHVAATKMGKEARAVAELIEVNGKKLKFKVIAYDEDQKIGEGYHNRYIIDQEKFMAKVNNM